MRRGLAILIPLALLLAATPAESIVGDDVDLAAPRAGDRGLYREVSIEWEGSDAADTHLPRALAFQLEPSRVIRDAYGLAHSAWPLRTYALENGTGRQSYTAHVRDRTSAPLIADDVFNRTVHLHYHGLLQEGREAVATVRSASLSSRSGSPNSPACPLLVPWQGETLREGQTLALGNACSPEIETAVAQAGASIDVAVVETTANRNGPGLARLFITVDHPSTHLLVKLWYREDIPYPMEISYELAARAGDGSSAGAASLLHRLIPLTFPAARPFATALPTDADGDGVARGAGHYVLTRFQAGDGETLPGIAGLEWPARSTDTGFAPVTRWGPRAGGETFVFSLSDAVESINTDPRYLEFRRWQDEHTDWKLSYAHHEELFWNERYRYEAWGLVVVSRDGTGWYLVAVNVTSLRVAGEEVPIPGPDFPGGEGERIDVSSMPYPEDLGHGVPTVQSVLASWERAVANDPTEQRAARDGLREPNHFTWSHVGREARIVAGWRDPRTAFPSPTDPSSYELHLNFSWVEIEPRDGAVERLASARTDYALGTLEATTGPPTHWAPRSQEGSTATPWAAHAPSVSAVIVGGLGGLLMFLLVKVCLWPLYSRIDPDDLLEHPIRQAIYDILQEQPGASIADIVSTTGQSRSTIRHHLSKLQEGCLVRAVGEAFKRRWFVVGTMSKEEMETEAVLSTGASREVFEAICHHPGCSLTELSTCLGKDPATVHRIVDRLVAGGIVARIREGQEVSLRRVHPADGS